MAPRICLQLLFILSLTLGGCARIQLDPLPEGMTREPPTDWQARTRALSAFDQWTLTGKLAVRQPTDSGSAVINRWQQRGERYDIRLSSSFMGLGSTQLRGSPSFLELTLNSGDRYRSTNPPELIEAATGWQLPVNELTWWLRGLPAPNTEARLLFDEQRQLAILEQQNWEIRYDRWQRFEPDLPALPARITALKGEKRVRVVITGWTREN